MKNISTLEMEVALMNHFNFRQKLIVPNVQWGMIVQGIPLHECDLLICNKDGYLTEIEIKISIAGLKAEKKKNHCHNHPAIKYLYFAIPEYLYEKAIEFIPENAGIITVERKKQDNSGIKYIPTEYFKCLVKRNPKYNKGCKLKDFQILKLDSLGAMRTYTLKKRILKNAK